MFLVNSKQSKHGKRPRISHDDSVHASDKEYIVDILNKDNNNEVVCGGVFLGGSLVATHRECYRQYRNIAFKVEKFPHIMEYNGIFLCHNRIETIILKVGGYT